MDDYRQRENHGALATFCWIGSGLYLYLTTEGASFFSWSALGFFLVGMFAAAIVFGAAGYLLQRGVAKLLVRVVDSPTPATVSFVTAVGWLIMAVEMLAVFLAARWVFGLLA